MLFAFPVAGQAQGVTQFETTTAVGGSNERIWNAADLESANMHSGGLTRGVDGSRRRRIAFRATSERIETTQTMGG